MGFRNLPSDAKADGAHPMGAAVRSREVGRSTMDSHAVLSDITSSGGNSSIDASVFNVERLLVVPESSLKNGIYKG